MGESFLIVNLVHDREKQGSVERNRSYGGSGNYSVSTDSEEQPNTLRLKIFGGPSTGEVSYHYPSEGVVKIGRSNNCEVQIDDAVLSKFQSCITFNAKENMWMLQDGYSNKNSLNGTWLYLHEDFDIYDGMIFKANQTLFEAQLHQ